MLLRLFTILFFLFTAVIFTNCGKPSEPETPVVTLDAWDTPVGDLVQGATLFEGWTDLRVLDAPVNVTGGWTDSVFVANNGMSLYFAYTRFDTAAVMDSGTFVVTGPPRNNMTGDYFKNFKADLTSNGWVVNMLPPQFNTDPNAHESSLSANAAENLIVWVKWDSVPLKANMYFSTKNTDGTWAAGTLIPAPAQSPNCSNDNPFVVGSVATGFDLYFESDRIDLACTAGNGKRHIYHSYFDPVSQTFSPVDKVAGLNGTEALDEDMQVHITSDKKQAFWTATRYTSVGVGVDYGIYTADLVGTAYMNPRPILRPNFSPPYTGMLIFPGEVNVVELPQGWLIYMICGIAQNESATASKGAVLKICRMKKPRTAEHTAAKKINSAGWSDSPFISRDGQRLYFMYSRYDFAPWILGGSYGSIQIKGPDRPGLQKSSNPFDESDIYMSTKNTDGTWGEPVNIGLNGAYGDASGMEIDSGNTFVWLRGNGTGNNVVSATKNSNGTWGAVADFGATVNVTGKIQDNPHISPDGSGVFYVSTRDGGLGGKDIWFSLKTAGVWGAPVNMGAPFNSAGDEDQMWISPISNEVYWNTSVGIKKCVSNGSTCVATPELVSIPGCGFAAEVSMPDDGKTIYFGCGDVVTGRVSIMYSEKQSDGSWGTAKPVD